MKYFFVLILLGGYQHVKGQASPTPKTENLTLLGSQYTTVNSNQSFANWQYKAWNALLKNDSSNSTIWLQTYIWLERDKRTPEKEKKIELNRLVTVAKQHIATNAAFFLIQFLHSRETDFLALRKAFETAEDKTMIYPYWIQYHIRKKLTKNLKEDCIAYDKLHPITKSLKQYHTNVLESAKKNAVVYARGLNDLVPMCVLQNVYGIRTDITLIYYEDGQILKEMDYLCLSLGKTIIEQHPKTSFTGLLVKNAVENSFTELKNNLEKLLHEELLPYQTESSILTDIQIAALQKNYLPALLLLLPYYEKTNDSKQHTVKKVITEIYRYAFPEKLDPIGIQNRKMDLNE